MVNLVENKFQLKSKVVLKWIKKAYIKLLEGPSQIPEPKPVFIFWTYTHHLKRGISFSKTV